MSAKAYLTSFPIGDNNLKDLYDFISLGKKGAEQGWFYGINYTMHSKKGFPCFLGEDILIIAWTTEGDLWQQDEKFDAHYPEIAIRTIRLDNVMHSDYWNDQKVFTKYNADNNVRFFQSPEHIEAFVKGRLTRNERTA